MTVEPILDFPLRNACIFPMPAYRGWEEGEWSYVAEDGTTVWYYQRVRRMTPEEHAAYEADEYRRMERKWRDKYIESWILHTLNEKPFNKAKIRSLVLRIHADECGDLNEAATDELMKKWNFLHQRFKTRRNRFARTLEQHKLAAYEKLKAASNG